MSGRIAGGSFGMSFIWIVLSVWRRRASRCGLRGAGPPTEHRREVHGDGGDEENQGWRIVSPNRFWELERVL